MAQAGRRGQGDADSVLAYVRDSANAKALGAAPLAVREKEMAGDMESLAGVTAQSMALDVASPAVTQYPMPKAAPGLVHTPYLAMTSDDGLAPDTDALVAAIRALGGTQATTVHAPTDHAWSDRRIALESLIVLWLQGVK